MELTNEQIKKEQEDIKDKLGIRQLVNGSYAMKGRNGVLSKKDALVMINNFALKDPSLYPFTSNLAEREKIKMSEDKKLTANELGDMIKSLGDNLDILSKSIDEKISSAINENYKNILSVIESKRQELDSLIKEVPNDDKKELKQDAKVEIDSAMKEVKSVLAQTKSACDSVSCVISEFSKLKEKISSDFSEILNNVKSKIRSRVINEDHSGHKHEEHKEVEVKKPHKHTPLTAFEDTLFGNCKLCGTDENCKLLCKSIIDNFDKVVDKHISLVDEKDKNTEKDRIKDKLSSIIDIKSDTTKKVETKEENKVDEKEGSSKKRFI